MEPKAKVDFIFNGSSSSQDIAGRLLACNFDVGVLRPYIGSDGCSYVDQFRKGKLEAVRTNANATLTKDAWKALDTAIMKAARARLRVVADLRAAGLTFSIPNGMGKTVLEYQRMTDINDAVISMDGLRLAGDDRPEFDLQFLPLPIIHKDFQFSARQIQASRDSNAPLDTTMGEAAARKVSEMVEKLTLGVASTYTYGGGTVYGMTNFTGLLPKTLTSPASTGWTPATTLADVLDMKDMSQAVDHYGPWMLYFSTAWDKYLDNDMSTNYPNKTLRMRLREIDGIQDVRTVNYLSGYDVVLLEMNPEVIRIVIGLDVMTLEWDTHGGLLKNYKVMTIMVPQIRADINGNTGIVRGRV